MPVAPTRPGPWLYLTPILLLGCSNIFMTFAWYGHLKFKVWSMAFAILVSWVIAFVEYCFAVPASRIGNAVYSPVRAQELTGGSHFDRVCGLHRHLFSGDR
jgi:uncharacterized protein